MHKYKILVADDDRALRSSLRTRLESMGYSVIESNDGLGVLSQTLKEQVHVILLDQGMPNGDGRSIARVIRQECNIPIVFLSGHDREEFRSIAMQLSDVYYLPKPFEDEKLFHLLQQIICDNRSSSTVTKIT